MKADFQIVYRNKHLKIGTYQCLAKRGEKSETQISNNYTLLFQLKGGFRHFSSGQTNMITSEQVVLQKAGYEYQTRHDHIVNASGFFIELDPEYLENLSGLSPELNRFLQNKIYSCLAIANDPWKTFLIWEYNRIRNAEKPGNHEIVTHLLRATLCDDFRMAPISVEYHEAVDRAKQYITENFINDISIDDIAQAAFISSYHFSRMFKRNTSLSPHKFLNAIRLRNACRLLLESNLNVAHIGYSCGFSNSDYFVTLFKNKIGLTPSEFRERGIFKFSP